MIAKEVFSGVTLWDRASQEAEAARDRKLERAAAERDRIVGHLPGWNVHSPERIKQAAQARYDLRAKAAEEKYEAACASAMKVLMELLDEREKAPDDVVYSTIDPLSRARIR